SCGSFDVVKDYPGHYTTLESCIRLASDGTRPLRMKMRLLSAQAAKLVAESRDKVDVAEKIQDSMIV
ncbi:hypothetical protein CFP56_024484, partial [Quercus suber]